MAELVREPIGLRVLIRALRPEDREPFLLWRADPQSEADALIERGQVEEQALLWASLLRWSEAQSVAEVLSAEGWVVTLLGVRAIALPHAIEALHPPSAAAGWTFEVAAVRLRAIAEDPASDDEALARLLDFLEQ